MSLLPGILTKNWQLKLSALALSILLWTVPRFEAQDTHVFQDVPVRVDLRDPAWFLLGSPQPATVDVTVSGPARELLAVSLERPPLRIPVDSVAEGVNSFLLRRAWFTLDGREGVVVEEISPSEVRISFEPRTERISVLAASLTGSLPEGLSQAGPPVVVPPTVQVTGPASKVEGLDTIPLLPLNLSAVAGTRRFSLAVDPSGLDSVNVYPPEGVVEISVEPTQRWDLPDLPVEIPPLDPPIPLRVTPSTVTLTLEGAQSLLEGIRPQDLRVTFPLTEVLNLAPGEEKRVYPSVEGLHELLERDHELSPPWVLLRRPAGQ